MQSQPRARTAGPECASIPRMASLDEVLRAIDRLAATIKSDTATPMYGLWAAKALADRLDVTSALSGSSDRVDVIADLGNDWVRAIGRALDEHPGRTPETLRAAMGVIERVVEEVRRRGLAG